MYISIYQYRNISIEEHNLEANIRYNTSEK